MELKGQKATGMSKIRLSLGIKYKNNYASGKHKFANRLIKEIETSYKDSIEIVSRNETSDVHITFDGILKEQKNIKNVYRIDGIWINSAENYLNKNKPIQNGIQKSDWIIYQSEFCKEAVEKVFDINRKENSIIYNGADPKEFERNRKYRPFNRPFFIAAAKWRPHKRLKYIVEGFLASECKKESYLYVYGDVDERDKVKFDRVLYGGWSDKTSKILPWAIASLHLSYLDWMPNSCVESLVAGTACIYSNSGGLPYLVGGNGVGVKDKTWDYKPLKLYEDQPLDIQEIANAYDDCFNKQTRPKPFKRPDLYISNIAKQYVDVITKLARG